MISGKIKDYLLFRNLKFRASEKTEKKSLFDAKKIGILSLKNDAAQQNTIEEFKKELLKNNKEVKTIFFTKEDLDAAKPQELIFNKKDLNWYNKPSEKMLQSFIEEKFDLILNFDTTNFKTFHFIVAHTQGYKIAFNDKYNTYTYDFLIKCNNISTQNLIKNLKLYLT